jgi:hypothetical protein
LFLFVVFVFNLHSLKLYEGHRIRPKDAGRFRVCPVSYYVRGPQFTVAM